MAKLSEYLKMIDEYITNLNIVIRDVKSESEFSSKPDAYYSTLHLLQLSIQCLIDMSSRFISLTGARKPKEYSELAEIMYEEKILDDVERKLFANMIRFKNLLIHVYARVSPSIVYKIAKESAGRDIRTITGKIISAARARGYDP
jgi:uncharacterized protein YutE (UPF0331/DUF86 family)